jgi:single-stranded DNA-binding protein
MSHLNKVLLIGKVTRKPQLATVAGAPRADMLVQTSYPNGDSDVHEIEISGPLAETCAEHLDVGRLVYVEGTLHGTDNRGFVRANHVHFLRRPE